MVDKLCDRIRICSWSAGKNLLKELFESIILKMMTIANKSFFPQTGLFPAFIGIFIILCKGMVGILLGFRLYRKDFSIIRFARRLSEIIIPLDFNLCSWESTVQKILSILFFRNKKPRARRTPEYDP